MLALSDLDIACRVPFKLDKTRTCSRFNGGLGPKSGHLCVPWDGLASGHDRRNMAFCGFKRKQLVSHDGANDSMIRTKRSF